jgi:hypothetical protein
MFSRINTENAEYWSNNKIIRRLREFRIYCKCLTESFNAEFRKDFDSVLLSIARVMNNLTIQYGFDKGNVKIYLRG